MSIIVIDRLLRDGRHSDMKKPIRIECALALSVKCNSFSHATILHSTVAAGK